jgi:hypothetical protein
MGELALHLAKYVVLALGTIVAEVICVPPVAADVLNHPTKVCPALVGVDGKELMLLPGTLLSVDWAGVPPFPLNVRVTGLAVHLAKYVVLLFGTIVAEVICVPPVAADVLNQPTKVNPDLIGTGNVPMFSPKGLVSVCVTGLPPFPLNVRIMSAGVHLA